MFPYTNKKCLTPLFWLIPNLLCRAWVQAYYFTAEKIEMLIFKELDNNLG